MSNLLYENLKNLNLNDDAIADLEFSEGCDVYVCNDDEVVTALERTDVIAMLSEFIATPKIRASTKYGGNVLQQLRDKDLLEEYSIRDGTFSEFLTKVITENFFELELVDSHIESYDYKRGFCTLSTNLQVPVSRLLDVRPELSGWEVSVKTSGGTLKLGG